GQPLTDQQQAEQLLGGYASQVISSVVRVFLNEHLQCQASSVDPSLTRHTVIADLKGQNSEIDIRPEVILQKADTRVDDGIAKLKGSKRQVFDLLLQKCLGIMPESTAGSIQLTEAPGANLLLKTFVLQKVAQARPNEITAILKGRQGI